LVWRNIYSKERGGSRKRSSGKPLKFTLLHVSMYLFQTSLLNYNSQVHYQTDQNVKCIIIMRIEAISFQIY
jgi:hypothetical protein